MTENDRLTMTSDKGGVAFTFDLDVTCEKSEITKILKVAQRLKEYEDIGTVEKCRENKRLLEFLYDTINPNDMESYLSIYNATNEKSD